MGISNKFNFLSGQKINTYFGFGVGPCLGKMLSELIKMRGS